MEQKQIITAISFAAIGSAVTALSLYSYDRFLRKKKLKKLQKEFIHSEFDTVQMTPIGSASSVGSSAESLEFSRPEVEDDEVVREQLTRNYSFFGDDGMKSIRSSFVIVVGCGGVGSHAALHLLRSGVGKLRLIDFDQVTVSSLNRHAVAVRQDVGTPKVIAMKKFFQKVMPDTEVDARVELFRRELADVLLAGNPDYVLDCIDNIDTKIDLIKYCHDKNIKVIASAGAACKADPTAIRLADISNTSEDRLARAVRTKLKKVGVGSGVPTVFSIERQKKVSILPLQEEAKDEPKEFAALPTFRVRILPVLGTLPSMFGAAMATYVLCSLADFPMKPLSHQHIDKMYTRILSTLTKNEKLLYNSDETLKFGKRDVGYMVDTVWEGVSPVSGSKEILLLVRWRKSKPTTLDNLILLTTEEAQLHVALDNDNLSQLYGTKFIDSVDATLAQVIKNGK